MGGLFITSVQNALESVLVGCGQAEAATQRIQMDSSCLLIGCLRCWRGFVECSAQQWVSLFHNADSSGLHYQCIGYYAMASPTDPSQAEVKSAMGPPVKLNYYTSSIIPCFIYAKKEVQT